MLYYSNGVLGNSKSTISEDDGNYRGKTLVMLLPPYKGFLLSHPVVTHVSALLGPTKRYNHS